MSLPVERVTEKQAEVQRQPVVGGAPWEFRFPNRPDGKPQWLGLNNRGVEACIGSLKDFSRDFRKATE